MDSSDSARFVTIFLITDLVLPGFPRYRSSSIVRWVVDTAFRSPESFGASNSVQPTSRTFGFARRSSNARVSANHRFEAKENI